MWQNELPKWVQGRHPNSGGFKMWSSNSLTFLLLRKSLCLLFLNLGPIIAWSIECGRSEAISCFPAQGFKELAASTFCLLELPVLESSYHAVRKPKAPHGEANVERNQGPWLPAPAELPASSQYPLASHVYKPSWKRILQPPPQPKSVLQRWTFPAKLCSNCRLVG